MIKPYNEYADDLGSYRSNWQRGETLNLFNLSLDAHHYNFLDSIDFDYYEGFGFTQLEKDNPEIETDKNYKKFKSEILSSKSIKDKKSILLHDDYKFLRRLLIATRVRVVSSDFKINKERISEATAELKAELANLTVNTNIEGAANLRAYISRMADERIILEGRYYLASLRNEYLSKIRHFVINTDSSKKYSTDQFGQALYHYLSTRGAAANTGLAAIQITGSIDRERVKIDTITTELQSKFKLPPTEATRLAASIKATFDRNETTSLKSKFNNVFILRYFTSETIDQLPL
jgi:hypothetical protein